MRRSMYITVLLVIGLCSLFVRETGANNALLFDGDGDYVQMLSLVGNPPEGTIMAWAYISSYDLGSNMLNLLFGQRDNLQLGLGDSSISADGYWVFRMRDSGGFKNAVGPLAILDEWIHVAATWNGTDAILYLNGVEEARVTVGALVAASPNGLRLGCHPYADQNYWDGMIDELSVWTVARTQAEIQEKMNSTLGPEFYDEPTSGLILYLRCDEDPGSPVTYDLTANQNDGTLTGDTDFVTSGAPMLIFIDGFESGDFSAWSISEP